MNAPELHPPRPAAEDTSVIPAYLPVPGLGVLAVNSFVIRGAEPILVDTGLAALRPAFLSALEATTDVEQLRWIWLTHADPDHAGNLDAVLRIAPRAEVVTTFLGAGKLGLLGLPTDRIRLVRPGEELLLGDRRVVALRPPTYDAPETTGLFDVGAATLYCADAFGALLDRPAECAAELPPSALREGMTAWSRVDAPWLADVDARRLDAAGRALRRLAPRTVLGSHLPPAHAMLGALLEHLDSAHAAAQSEGPRRPCADAGAVPMSGIDEARVHVG